MNTNIIANYHPLIVSPFQSAKNSDKSVVSNLARSPKIALIMVFIFALPVFTQAADPELTVMGAELAGNEEQTIPAWTGGITTPPAAYKVGDTHPDPFGNDEVMFTIDFGSMIEFKDQLSPGYMAMMEKHPNTYKLKIYPTRRSASHPQRILDHTTKFSSQARIIDNGAGLEGIVQGIPFPQPANGEQAIWNSRLSFKGGGIKRYINSTAPTEKGKYQLSVVLQEIMFPRQVAEVTQENFDGILARGINYVQSPIKAAGAMILFHANLNSVGTERNVWFYNPKKRRVKRAPRVAGSTPSSASDGIHLQDQNGMFSGKITDFNWQLLGKKEMYIPYNAYQLHSDTVSPDDIIKPGHMNQQLGRYELHRVWMVEATRKEGVDHPHKRRVYYLDEDSWHITMAEHYDDDDQLDRFSESHTVNYYEVPVLASTLDAFYQLNTKRYFLQGLDNQHEVSDFTFRENAKYFKSGSLKRRAKR
jgi:uncharacterized protein DUF1329